jgi:hypothetical protein
MFPIRQQLCDLQNRKRIQRNLTIIFDRRPGEQNRRILHHPFHPKKTKEKHRLKLSITPEAWTKGRGQPPVPLPLLALPSNCHQLYPTNLLYGHSVLGERPIRNTHEELEVAMKAIMKRMMSIIKNQITR